MLVDICIVVGTFELIITCDLIVPLILVVLSASTPLQAGIYTSSITTVRYSVITVQFHIYSPHFLQLLSWQQIQTANRQQS